MVLQVHSLRKQFGSVIAVDDVSLAVGRGEIVGLLGPNGAGKTTTINMLMGVLTPTSGSIVIDGIDLTLQRQQAISRTNFAAVYAPLPGNLTVRENLRYFGMIYGVPNLKARIDAVLAQFDLQKFRDTRVGALSSGEQTRACLAKAMLNRPKLLFLDEPTASLDPATARDIRAVIKDFANEGESGVLWTSHNMQEVQEMCDRVLLVSRGRVVLEGDPRTLASANGYASLEDLFVALARETLTEAA